MGKIKVKMSEEAWRVWLALSDEQKCALRREHPFKAERDTTIHQLALRKVSHSVIGEIADLSRDTVSRILKKQRDPLIKELQHLTRAIRDHTKIIEGKEGREDGQGIHQNH